MSEKWIGWDKSVMIQDRMWKGWLRPIIKTANTKSKELEGPPSKATPKIAGCFKFDDGTTQNWVLNQLYDTVTQKQVVPYFPFTLANSHSLSLSASVYPLIVTDPSVKQCDLYFESPDLSSDSHWQNIKGYSIDVYRLFSSLCGEAPNSFFVQLQLYVIDTSDNSVHLFAEWSGGDFVFHDIQLVTPYHFIWTPDVLSETKYKVKQVRIRITMPGYLGPGGGECACNGQWLIGNVCPIT